MSNRLQNTEELAPGDALDFWRVLAVEPPYLLLAEMKLPGEAVLEVVADNTDWSLILVVLLWKSARVSMPWIVVRRPDSLVFRVCRAEIFAVH